MFFLAFGVALICLLVWVFKNNGQGPDKRGWWGDWGRGPKEPAPEKPKDPGPNPDNLLEIPYEWVEAYGKWAKQVVKDNLKKIMVNSGPR